MLKGIDMRSHIYVLFLFLSSQILAQSTIRLNNPSFEDIPKQSVQPIGWKNCGFLGESPPDVHPASDSLSYWEVSKPAHDGDTYLGMVVRDNDTYERVAQFLSEPLVAGDCYEMSIYLCRSAIYMSQSRKTGQLANYNTPVVLRVYGGQSICDTRELLYETPMVKNTEWQKYDMEFKPKTQCEVIILEAMYKTPILNPYNGNLLLDNASPIIQKPCPEDEIALDENTSTQEASAPNRVRPTTKISSKKSSEVKTYKKPEILKDLDMETLKEGQRIRISNLSFTADSSNITEESQKVLDEIYHFMDYYPDVKLEIGGHANLKPRMKYAKDLSKERAEAVVEYLVKKGIEKDRLNPVGYGNTKPLISSTNKIANRINQRVEIKVLSLDEEDRE